ETFDILIPPRTADADFRISILTSRSMWVREKIAGFYPSSLPATMTASCFSKSRARSPRDLTTSGYESEESSVSASKKVLSVTTWNDS
ncbi:hypothetical protein CEXT_407591, partial [Caerostris extrusa]